MYVSERTLEQAIAAMSGTASYMLRIWLTLKAMGLSEQQSVNIDTSNSTDALNRLFASGSPEGRLFTPFETRSRFAWMKPDAARSIIQTNIVRWGQSGSVVSVDPTAILDIRYREDTKSADVSLTRTYPEGLGWGMNGFARADDARVAIPIWPFIAWFYRFDDLDAFLTTEGDLDRDKLYSAFTDSLHLSGAEIEAIFVQSGFEIELTGDRIDDSRLYELCEASISEQPTIELVHETKRDYAVRIRTMTTINSQPLWLRREPESVLAELMAQGRRAILLYGPPRTGKTRAVDTICPRNDSRRATIQLHEGWGYENLITGLFPVTDSPGEFAWRDGELLKALRKGKKHIVLEEVNRTRVSQALGEVFSLLEVSYRGPEHAIQLPNGESFAIDPDVTLYFTMNNIDRSTEDIDDALLGRVDSVEFPPRVEALAQILESKQIDQTVAAAIRRFFTTLQDLYPLGHGYFASLDKDTDFRLFYSTRIRPVLVNHFASFDPSIVAQVDNEVDELFD